MIMAATPTPPADVAPKLVQQTASVPDLPNHEPAESSTTASSPPPKGKVRRTRHARRRRRGEEDSEDEIVREAGSGSESDRGAVDSETESEDGEDGDEPSTSAPVVNGDTAATASTQPPTAQSTIPAAANWSDMVTSELDGGADASLPVIDFADMASASEAVSAAPEATPVTKSADSTEQAPASSNNSNKPSGRPVQSARQAYLERLDKDPQFIPRVGAFWGHDDRLLDKGLRSMSPWWRERQMAFRGRGGMGRGGFDGGFRGRGRGRGGVASYGGRGEADAGPASEASGAQVEGEATASAASPAAASAPAPRAAAATPPPPPAHPSDLPWGHDGFEELKRVEAERAARGRGRGGFRGRGGIRGVPPIRGGHHPVNGIPRPGPPNAPSGLGQFKKNRVEKPWTKDLAVHLYADPALQPKDNQGAGIRLKFPGSPNDGVVVRLPAATSDIERTASPASAAGTKKGPKVKLPNATKPQGPSVAEAESVADNGDFAQTVGGEPLSTPPAELTVEPVTVTVAVPTTNAEPANAVEVPVTDPVAKLEKQFSQMAIEQQATATQEAKSEPQALLNGKPAITQSEDKHPESAPQAARQEAVASNHIQIPPQPYPQYSYGLPLPPGIAMDENGVCFEVATGRVVILQQPVPSPMYHPRPVPSLPGGSLPAHLRHMQRNAMQNPSPDAFVPSPYSDGAQSTPPEAYAYPERPGVPYFAQRRTSGAVSIRSPTESRDASKQGTSSPAGSSLLRAAVHAAPFQPTGAILTPHSAPFVPNPGYFPRAYGSPLHSNGPSALPDDPAIVGQDPSLAQYPQYYPADPMYAYPQGEYAYTHYGYDSQIPEGYVQPADGRGPPVYY